MTALQGQPGELHFTLQITRAATGKTEEVRMVGFLDPEQHQAFLEAAEKEQDHGGHSQ